MLSEPPVGLGILPLKRAEEELTKDTAVKLEISANYYQELYTSLEEEEGSAEAFLHGLRLSRLMEEHVLMLEAPISVEKIKEAIGVLKSNTAPGPDEFTAEFYNTLAELPVL